jgi:hypothetical protein
MILITEKAKLHEAVTILATSSKKLRTRIFDAWQVFNTIHVLNLPPSAKLIHADIMKALTRVQNGDPRLGAVRNSIDAMTPKQQKAVAGLIVDLLVEVASHCGAVTLPTSGDG